MHPLSLVVGVVVGGVVGYIVAATSGSKVKAELQKRLASTKEEIARLRKEMSTQLAGLKSGQGEAEQAAENARGKAGALEKAVEQYKAQVGQLQKSLEELEGARDKATEQSTGHQSARQQAEGRARQAQAQATEAVHRSQQLEAERDQIEAARAEAQKTAERRAQEIQRLRGELGDRANASGLDQSVEAFAEAAGSLDQILNVLLEHEHQTAVVLADTNGIVVSAVGENSLKEGMAAAAKVVSQIGAQLEGMVPFEVLRSFHLQDANAVIAGRTFTCAGETIALATYGPQMPSNRILDGAMANLNAALE